MKLSLALKLMAIPTLFGSLLSLSLLNGQALAIDTANAKSLISDGASCDAAPAGGQRSSLLQSRHGSVLVASAASVSDETEDFEFSEAESDASATLFGCDCSSCINALRQLRNPSLVDSIGDKGHCWTSMERRVSPETVREVLDDLKVKEAK